jgi:hypothetical protein
LTDKPPDPSGDAKSSNGAGPTTSVPTATDAAKVRKLPEANEFSPTQIAVRELLAAVQADAPDSDAIIEAIRTKFFADAAAQLTDPDRRWQQQRTRAYNALLGASKYGLVTPPPLPAELTELGSAALATKNDEELHRLLARHIIRELGGLEVLLALREMKATGLPINKTTLQDHLEQQGFKLPRATTHHTKLLQWLRQAGVLPPTGYEVSAEAVEDIAGISLDAGDTWSALTDEQRAFLRVLRRIALLEGEKPIPAKVVVDAVETEYGPIFKRPDQLAASIFKPLADPALGWLTQVGIGTGRGGKSGSIMATAKLLETEVDLLPEGEGWGIPPDLRAKLQKPLDQVYADLKSSNTHVKGIALELLAIRMAIDLTLTPTRLRERGARTGGAEVDLVAEAAHLHFSRWLLQCKNKRSVGVDALAKEIGMAVLLKAHVVVVVTTGTFSSSVVTYAKELAATSALQAVLVDKTELAAYRKGGAAALRKHFNEHARETLAVKRPQVVSEVEDA